MFARFYVFCVQFTCKSVMAIGVKCRQTRGKIQTAETTQTLFTNVDLRPIRSGVQWASFELCSNKRTDARCIFLCLEQNKMLIISLNLDSVLLSLHNSKLAYSGSNRASNFKREAYLKFRA